MGVCCVENQGIEGKKEKELIDMDISVVIWGGYMEVENGIGG